MGNQDRTTWATAQLYRDQHSKKLASTLSLFSQQFLPIDCKFEAKAARKVIVTKFPILDNANGILS